MDPSHEQRYHDALEGAMRRLVAAAVCPCDTESAYQGPTPQSQPSTLPTSPVPPTPRGREALEQAITGKTIDFLLHFLTLA